MFNQVKPGHVLRFGTDPTSIRSPAGVVNPEDNDNTLETPWPAANDLGLVQVLSHPSGPIGLVAADVAKRLRGGFSPARLASYSAPGLAVTAANRSVGAQQCAFVGYVDGRAYFIESVRTVFSKDFSGCMMVVYRKDGGRRVAHVAASQVRTMDCKQAFLNTLQANGAELIGWFKPYSDAADGARTVSNFRVIRGHIEGQISRLTTFGVITAANEAYSIDAFKPVGRGFGPNDWVITYVERRTLSTDWTV